MKKRNSLIGFRLIIILSLIIATTTVFSFQFLKEHRSDHFKYMYSSEIVDTYFFKGVDYLEKAASRAKDLIGVFTRKETQVIFYENTQIFTYATGFPWYVGGCFQDGKLKFQNPETLHSQKRLEHIAHHEYMHVLLEELTQKRLPLWFNEGFAEYFARYFTGKVPEEAESTYKFTTFAKLQETLKLKDTNKDEFTSAYSFLFTAMKELEKLKKQKGIINIILDVYNNSSFEDSFKSNIGMTVSDFEKQLG